MFRRAWDDLPMEPVYPADLNSLGIDVNENGQFINKETGKFAAFYITDLVRANELHKEALQESACKVVRDVLASHYDVKKLFLTGRDGTDVEATKPDAPHVTILSTDRKALAKKADVVIIIPERNQDLGVWAYRELLGAGGMDRGSVVGLVKKLQKTDLRSTTKSYRKARTYEELFESGAMVLTEETFSERNIPGIVILNPGQLVYSPKLQKNMSERSWVDRPKDHALAENFVINDEHNRVPGHKSPDEHVDTVLKHVVPEILPNEARIWMISISDGAESLVKYMGGRLSDLRKMTVANRTTKAMAFIEPSHDPEQITPELAKLKLSVRSKSWVLSNQPLGTILVLAPHRQPRARDYEDEIASDPIAVPTKTSFGIQLKPRRASQLTTLDEVVIGKPVSQSYMESYASRCRRRRAGTVPDSLRDANNGSIPFPPSYVPPMPVGLNVPPFNPFTVRPPSEGSPDISPTDEAKAAQENERKERVIEAALQTSMLSPSYLNQHDRMFSPQDDLETALLNRHRKAVVPDCSDAASVWDRVTKTFAPVSGATTGAVNPDAESSDKPTDAATTFIGPWIAPHMPIIRDFGYDKGNMFAKLEAQGIHGDRSDNSGSNDEDDVAVYSDSVYSEQEESVQVSEGDRDEQQKSTKMPGTYPDDEMESAKMPGGDYDDDEGLWMKPFKRAPSPDLEEHSSGDVSGSASPSDSAASVPELEPDVGDVEDSSESGSEGRIFAPDQDGGVRVDAGDEADDELSENEPDVFPSASDHEGGTADEDEVEEWSDSETAVPNDAEDLGFIEKGSLMLPESGTDDEAGADSQVPQVGDMLRVSAGTSDCVELIWPNVEDDVLKWFVEMSKVTF